MRKHGLHWTLSLYATKSLILGGEREAEVFISATGCGHAMPEKKMTQIIFFFFFNKVGNQLKAVY